MVKHVLETIDRQDRVRFSLQLARVRFEVQDIAERIGCTRQTLSPFMKGKEIGERLLVAAEEFARSEGYWIWDKLPQETPVNHIWNEAAGDFEALASVLRAPGFSDSAKAQRFTQTVTFYQTAIDAFLSTVESEND